MVWLPYRMMRSSQCHRTARDSTAPLDVGAEEGEIRDAVTVVHSHDAPFDDRSVVELFGYIVRGRADEFDAARFGPRYGAAPMKDGRNE